MKNGIISKFLKILLMFPSTQKLPQQEDGYIAGKCKPAVSF